MYKNHFSLIWNSQGFSFNKAREDIKLNFKVVDNVTSDKHVKNFIIYEHKPKKIQSQLTNLVVKLLTLIELSLMLIVYID